MTENVHLVDIRPLPRKDEKNWNYRSKIKPLSDGSKYIDAFNILNEKDEYFGDWVSKRKNFLNQKLAEFKNLKFIIAAGAPKLKIQLIKGLIDDINLEIEPVQEVQSIRRKGKNGNPDIHNEFWIGNVNLNGNPVCIGITHFFENRIIGLEGLKEFAMHLKK